MSLILFIHQDSSKKGEILKTAISQKINGDNLTIIKTFNAFKTRLKESPDFMEKEIFILLAESKNRLAQLISLIDLLEGRQIILILPDESKATLSRATLFFPRFFTPVSKTYDDLCDVIKKMIRQEITNSNQQ